jgi:carbonic anhydrase/acetyltransferase-like protein (isoleucine patch superfamily)
MNPNLPAEDFLGRSPSIDATAFVSPLAYVAGDVHLGSHASVWPFCSLRADLAPIRVGANSNIQDGAIVHVDNDLPAVIGEWVTVGHKAIIHACTIQDDVLVGMGAVILDGASVGHHSIIGANATVTGGAIIPPGSLVLGSPAKIKRTLTTDEQASIRAWAERYVKLSRRHMDHLRFVPGA